MIFHRLERYAPAGVNRVKKTSVCVLTMLAGMASLWEKTIGLELLLRLDSIK